MNIALRPVRPDDLHQIFEWRNTPFIVERSSSQQPVSWDKHTAWFKATLHANGRRLFVVTKGGIDIGLVRFDLVQPAKCIISVYLLEAYVGRGAGVLAVRHGCGQIQREWPGAEIIACVRWDNPMGNSCFRKSGFVQCAACHECPDGHLAWVLKGASNVAEP